MLFHGTSATNAVGIIRNGFRPSTSGSFGPGVYLTASPTVAARYSEKKTTTDKRKYLCKMLSGSFNICCFVNEVLGSENLRSYALNNRMKYVKKSVEGVEEDLINENEDSGGRRLRSCKTEESDWYNHHVCQSTQVMPRYFVQFKQRKTKSSVRTTSKVLAKKSVPLPIEKPELK